jgi:hypothetical protein
LLENFTLCFSFTVPLFSFLTSNLCTLNFWVPYLFPDSLSISFATSKQCSVAQLTVPPRKIRHRVYVIRHLLSRHQIFFLQFWWPLCKCAKFQLFSSSRTGLTFLDKQRKEYYIPILDLPGRIVWVLDSLLWFWWSLYKSAKFPALYFIYKWVSFFGHTHKIRFHPPLSDLRSKIFGFRISSCGVGGLSLSLPNFSFLPLLKVG